MKNIVISDFHYEERITKIAALFGSEVTNDCDEVSFSFENQLGSGTIRGINFDYGVGVMMFDVELTFDLTFEYYLGRRHPIQCLYNSQGNLTLSTSESEITHDISDYEAMIYAPKGDDNYSVTFKAGKKVQCVMVSVVRFLYLRKIACDIDTIPDTLQDMFKDTIGKKSFFFKSTSEPITTNTIIQLFKSDQSGLERKMLIEANGIKLITALIKRFRVESSYSGGPYRFSAHDIEMINESKNRIIDNIKNTPKVKDLALNIGMNSNKLQKGFHMLFGKSIRQFTISLKMHYALNLLDNGRLSISEIAYKVGYTNKGHFSNLFKKEFGLLPSEYNKRIPFVESVSGN
ncbi:MAG: AraC-like DNA-binding protein [Saprospiraceae bacterium]|jgi:AraC-like DNA-binding protein